MSQSSLVIKIAEAASMLGLMVIGGMTVANVSLKLAVQVGNGDWAEPIQTYLDGIMLGLLPAILFALMYWLLGKKVKTTTILAAIMAVCIVFAWLGIV